MESLKDYIKNHAKSGRTRFNLENKITNEKSKIVGKTVLDGAIFVDRNNLYRLTNISVHGFLDREKFNWIQEGVLIYDPENDVFMNKTNMIDLYNGYKDDLVTILKSYNLV